MSRSGDLRALHDDLIRKLIVDPEFRVDPDGSIWTTRKRNGKPGGPWRKAGRVETNGYIQISYQGKRLLAHRIVYQKFNGSLQSDLVVDHKDQKRQNNRPDNLQLATARSNRIYMERRKEENYAQK